MPRSLTRILCLGFLCIANAALAAPTASAAFLVNYTVESTGQTASAEFTFTGPGSLAIVLRETTPSAVSALTGGSAVLTRLGFHLPTGQLGGGAVQIGPGSASAGFLDPQLGSGADVSSHWGFTQGTLPDGLRAQALVLNNQANGHSAQADKYAAQEAADRDLAKQMRDAAAQILSNNPDPQMLADAADLIKAAELREQSAANFDSLENQERLLAADIRDDVATLVAQADTAPDYHFVGVLQPGETPFKTIPPGANLIGPGAFDGVQGGLLGDLGARGGLGVIGDSVTLTLNLTVPLDARQQAAFLRGLLSDSVVEYGSRAAFATAAKGSRVPVPSTVVLLATAGISVVGAVRFRQPRNGG